MDKINCIHNSRFNTKRYLLILITCTSIMHLADVSAQSVDCFYEPDIVEFICVPSSNPNPSSPIDDISTQINYAFDVRVGDINYDGKEDIYLQRLDGPNANGVIHRAILVGENDGSFSNYSASTWQLSSAANWPKKNIKVAKNDFNLDGYIDVMLKGVSDHISGSKDHIIFSNQQANGRADAVTNMDDQFYKFFSNAAMYTADGDYFANHSEISYQIHYEYVWVWLPGHYPDFDFSCGYLIVPIYIPVIHYDEDVIDPRALLANLAMESGDYVRALQWWRYVLGTELDDNVVVDDNLTVCLPPLSLDQCDSMKILYRLLNRMLSSGQDDLGPVDGSPSGQLRTRNIGGREYIDKYHLSVHARILGGSGLTTWNSGFSSESLSEQLKGNNGDLLSKYLDKSDAPWETRVIRTIYHPDYDNSHHFSVPLNAASVSYREKNPVPYCHYPEDNEDLWLTDCVGYNSNSFAIGLINHVGGILSPFIPTTFGGKPLPDLTLDSHPGINKPLPSSAFE